MKDYLPQNPLVIIFDKNDVLCAPKVKTATYGIKSLRLLGPKIWYSLPNEIKSSQNINQFKALIKDW